MSFRSRGYVIIYEELKNDQELASIFLSKKILANLLKNFFKLIS